MSRIRLATGKRLGCQGRREERRRILFAARPGPFRTGEISLAKEVISALQPGMLCLADRSFLGYALWKQAMETGAHLLWRAKSHLRLKVLERYADGSYRSAIYASERDWRRCMRNPGRLKAHSTS